MKCEKCNKDLVIPRRAYINLESYNVGGNCLVAAECCGAGYQISMYIEYKTTPYVGNKKEDDWGIKIKK